MQKKARQEITSPKLSKQEFPLLEERKAQWDYQTSQQRD